MNLSERIQLILKENNLKQRDFAKELGVTESYISAIISGRNTNVSLTLACLIEEKYGYNSEWIMTAKEPKLKTAGKNAALSDVHKRAIHRIEHLKPEQVKAVLAFVNALDEIEKNMN